MTASLAARVAASPLPADTPIADLPGMTWHVSNPLARAGFVTLGDLAGRTEADLLKVSRFGAGRLAKLVAALDGAQ